MSAINNALSQLSKSQTVTKGAIEKAQIQVVKRTKALPWLIGGFSLSLAVGGWAISQQPQPDISLSVEANQYHEPTPLTPALSPTAKLTQSSAEIYVAEVSVPVEEPLATKSQPSTPIVVAAVVEKSLDTVVERNIDTNKLSLAKATTSDSPLDSEQRSAPPVSQTPASSGEVIVEQVELTPTQLADKAQARAAKALDANDLASAINHYKDALRYTPRNSEVRQKLAALFYGKGEVRKSVDLLQKGIALSQDDQSLRIAMAKLLLKEQQTSAALTPLAYLPANPSIEYLSLRAALAQKSAQDAMALESYQLLSQRDPENGRWWLGLGIQQERAFELEQAQQSYQTALSKVGLSSQSQQFIRDRLALLQRLQEQPNEN